MGKVLIKAKALNELKFTNSSVSTIFQANLAKSVHLSSSVLTENLWHKWKRFFEHYIPFPSPNQQHRKYQRGIIRYKQKMEQRQKIEVHRKHVGNRTECMSQIWHDCHQYCQNACTLHFCSYPHICCNDVSLQAVVWTVRQAQNLHQAHAAAHLAGLVHLEQTTQQYCTGNNAVIDDSKATWDCTHAQGTHNPRVAKLIS